jgi:hypothetical protein
MVQDVGLTAAEGEDTAQGLVCYVHNLMVTGLSRPVGFSCNDPECGDLQGLSEVGLVVPGVRGPSRREGAGVCGRCKAVCYCSTSYQWDHEEDHLAHCRSPLKQQQQKGEEQQQRQQG